MKAAACLRWPRRFDSLALRLILMVLCATLIAWLVLAVSLHFEMSAQVKAKQNEQLAAYADMLWQSFGDDDDLQAMLARKPGEHTPLAFALYRQDGELLAASSAPPLPRPTTPGARIEFAGEPWIVAVRQDETRQLVIGESQHRQEEIVEEVSESLALPAVLIIALLLPVLAVAIHRGLKPLRAVDAALVERAPDNLDPINLPAPREIAPILHRLNALFAQVTATLERERRFTSDAAHELRTPLAALRVQLEIMQTSPRPEAREKALVQMLIALDRTSHLLGQLLDLARLDHARLPPGEPLDLPELARQALQDAELPYDESVLKIDTQPPWRGHAGLIGLLLRNLVDNARRYAGADAVIRIEINAHSLSVMDNGPGTTPEVLARLGERFFRPPGQQPAGAGLGISIVQRIADLHGARLHLANRPEGGFLARLVFPCE